MHFTATRVSAVLNLGAGYPDNSGVQMRIKQARCLAPYAPFALVNRRCRDARSNL
jgi:hypothetical protein